MLRYSIFFALAGLIAVSAVPASAREALVIITMAGEAYNGPPKFKMVAEGRVLGTREVTNAADATKGESVAFDVDDKPAGLQKFNFTIPDIDNTSYLEIEFINDAWAGEGKPGDRNLYVLGLSLSIVEKSQTGATARTVVFGPLSFETKTESGRGAVVTSRYAALYQRGLLRLNRPSEGWEASKGSQKASSAEQQEPAVAHESTGPSPACAVPPLELKGFAKNSTALSRTMQEQLAALPVFRGETSCIATIRAYAAGGPSDAFRAGLSLARAQEVAKELAELGLASDKIRIESATGRGRRVVISFE